MADGAPNLRELAAIILLAAGALFVIPFTLSFRLRYLALAIGLTMLGATLLHWLGAITVWSVPAYLLWSWLGDRHYARHYPVFATAPLRAITDEQGKVHHLHVCESPRGFLIGIDYAQEVDGNPMRHQTRWKDKFPSLAAAEQELLARYENSTQ